MPAVVLLDTNVWVSALINPRGQPARLLQYWYADRFAVAVSLPLLEEIGDVLTRPRIARKYPITAEQVAEFLRLLTQRAHIVVPSGTLHECRDPEDDLIIETALLAQAQYVVSRDDDIKRDLDLIEHLRAHGLVVASVQQFLDRLAQGEL